MKTEPTSWLEMRADYQAHMKELEKTLEDMNDSELSRDVSRMEIDTYLKKKQLRSYINAYRRAYNQLGLQYGEMPDERWLDGLNFHERLIFLLRYTYKMSNSQVAVVIKTSKEDVADTFQRVVRKVTSRMVEQEKS